MRAALAEQLRLLTKRCREFDNGDWGEPIPEDALWASGYLYSQSFAKDEHSFSYELFPKFGDTHYSAEIPARRWWDQIVEVGGPEGEPHVFRRRDVISGVANKDGGAHLASLIPESYDVMSMAGGLVTITMGTEGDTEDIPIVGVHLAMLRQIAYEVLNSPALRRLADKGTW
jgi:hypothetical protein